MTVTKAKVAARTREERGERVAPRDYFAQIPWSLMDHAPSDVWAVYAVLHRTARGDRRCCTKSLQTIAREAGLGRDRTRTILRRLTEAGYLITVVQAGQPTHRRLNTDYPERYNPQVLCDKPSGSATQSTSTALATPTGVGSPPETGSPTEAGSPTPTEIGRPPLPDPVADPYRNQYPKQDGLSEMDQKDPPLTPQGGERTDEGEEKRLPVGTVPERSQASGSDPLTREMTYRAAYPRLVSWKGLVDLALDFPDRWSELVVGHQGRFPSYAEPVVETVRDWLAGLTCYADRQLTAIDARDWISSRLRSGETDRVLGMLDQAKQRQEQSRRVETFVDPHAEQKAAHAAALARWRQELEQERQQGAAAQLGGLA